MDCDMLVRADISELWDLRDDQFAVMCVKHNHQPKENVKFLGAPQTPYSKKNWSSVMLFNNSRCHALSPEYVNSATGLELHQFKWLESEELVGDLPKSWNHLVGYDSHDPLVNNVHFTSGGPYFKEYSEVEYAKEWFDSKKAMEQVEMRPIHG